MPFCRLRSARLHLPDACGFLPYSCLLPATRTCLPAPGLDSAVTMPTVPAATADFLRFSAAVLVSACRGFLHCLSGLCRLPPATGSATVFLLYHHYTQFSRLPPGLPACSHLVLPRCAVWLFFYRALILCLAFTWIRLCLRYRSTWMVTVSVWILLPFCRSALLDIPACLPLRRIFCRV